MQGLASKRANQVSPDTIFVGAPLLQTLTINDSDWFEDMQASQKEGWCSHSAVEKGK